MKNIAIIGCGYWGPNLVRVFAELKNCCVKSISDINEERMNIIRQKYPSIKKFRDYHDILKDKSIDAVVVATNLSTHYKIAGDVIKCKKHLLIEKPITPSPNEAETLVKLSKKYEKILMVGHTFLYNAGIRKLKEYISNKEIGNLLYLHAMRTNLGPIRKDASALWDLASHDISIFLYLLNTMPTEVSAKGGVYIKKNVEDVVFLTLTFSNGLIGHIHVSWLEPCKIRNLTLIGDKKMVVFDDINQLEPIRIYDKGVVKEKKYDTFGEFQLILRDGDVVIPKIALSEPLKNECSEFIDAIENKKTPVSNAEFGLRVVKVLFAAQKSLENRGKPERII